MKSGRDLIRLPVLQPLLELLAKLSENGDYREVIGKDFMPSCVAVVSANSTNPDIVSPGVVV